jgi:hypothetical protein
MKSFKINSYRFDQTSEFAPEQYEIYDCDNNQIGYLRLRHGVFSVRVPDYGGTEILTAYPKGDADFEPEERYKFLRQALDSIIEYQVNELFNEELEES